MSWNVTFSAPTKTKAKEMVAEAQAPDSIKAYLTAAIEACADEDRSICVTSYGHLYDGHNYDVTSATIDVRQVPK